MNSYLILFIIAILNFIIKAIPFILFKDNKIPSFVKKIGEKLPQSIIALLVIYCIKDVNFMNIHNFLYEFIAISIVLITYKIKSNVLLSIFTSTIIYMILVQFF